LQTENNDMAGLTGDGLGPAELEELLASVAGVADIEVDLREDGSPHLRIWLDGSVPAEEVGEEVKIAMAAARSSVGTGSSEPDRKVGLGRGLGEILAADEGTTPPSHFHPDVLEPEEEPPPNLALVAVEETAGGISVRAADSNGGIAFSPVEDPRSLNQAVVSAVARLRQERPVPRLAGVEIRDVSGDPVLTVVLTFADGRRSVGAALVEGGMPFTLGRAVWEAIGSSD
jgi:hypothetical protein